MKKIIYLIASVFLLSNIQAQSNWCASDEELNDFHEAHPEMKTQYQQDLLNTVKNVQNYQVNKANGKIIIPLAIHIIHYNGVGNISKAQIDDGIRIINEDFNKLNSDTSAVRSMFQPYISDVGIEFRLAKLDPNGNPTEGITRTNHHFSNSPSNRNSPKGLAGWDRLSYLNVWIVNSIPSFGGLGNVLGFAQFPPPSSGSLSTYGLVVRADEWGSIEAAQSTDGRTVTHEIGHCLNLLHTFQGACGSLCHATGDFICDTPPQFDDNNNSCNFNLNSCSNDASGGVGSNPNPYSSNLPDQLENYMGYGITCLGMFTEGQKTRMLSAINTYTKLDSISSDFNEIQTGTNDGFVGQTPAPIIEIFDTDKFTCAGGTVTFSEDAYGGPLTTYSWSFPGGTPSTSSSPNPTITYNTPGDYDVTLRISNAGGADSLVLSDYVHVSSIAADYSAYNYNAGFETVAEFDEWIVIDKYVSPTFDRVAGVSNSGNACAWISNRTAAYRTSSDQLVSPTLKMSDVISPTISMEVAYKRRNSGSDDKIKVFASTDCGASWSNLLTMTPVFFAYDNSTSTGTFVPTQASQWRTVTIPGFAIPSSIKTADNAMFMIEVENGGGNNIFIDNFRINGQPVGINTVVAKESDFVIFPNPAKDEVNINFNFIKSSENAQVYVQNILGEIVANIYQGNFVAGPYKFYLNTAELPKGIYFVTAELDGERITRKLVIN